jgi:2,3-bisphosphoglycerate-dependent phosphoglycerate mutase
LWRAYDTALSIGNAVSLPVITDEGLRERGFGAFEGKTFADIEQEWPDQAARWRKRDPAFSPEGGESLLQFRERVLSAIAALAALHPGQQIVVASHGGVMDVLYRAATGQDLQAPRTWQLGNAAINRLLWTPTEGSGGQFSLVGWADTFHLDDDSRDEAAA